MTAYIGIDPGFKGAIAVIEELSIQLIDTPSATIGKTKREYQVSQMYEILNMYRSDSIVAIEKVHSMPRQGVASAFTFGKGYGIWLGLLAALQMPYDEVTPQRWQKEMMADMQKGKDASRLRAMQIYPRLTQKLNKKSYDGRADALLIAEWRRRQG